MKPCWKHSLLHRGLRQGDPLFPFLFLFVADGLSTLLQKEVELNGIFPIKVCQRALGVSHLLFADDTLFFGPRLMRH
jgi:hypothetical protein